VKELLTFAVKLDLFVLVYVQFMIMLIEFQKVLSQEPKYSCSETADYSHVGMNHIKNCGRKPLTFLVAIKINKYIV